MKKKNMKKYAKKATALALILALSFAAAGCGQTGTSDTASVSGPGAGPDGAPPDGGQGGPEGAPGGQSAEDISWNGATEITDSKSYENETYTSDTSDENSVLISGSDATPTLTGITVEKTGDGESGDSQSFYGTNSAIMVKDKAQVTIKNATISTSSKGANGVFSYGGSATTGNTTSDGTTVTISDSTITTTEDGSGGIMTTGGGTTIANNLQVETSGGSSAAIRTDRGGGTVTVNGGTFVTNGLGSPTIYSTADISVSDANLTSNQSEGVCIEGTNSVSLTNCTLTASNTNKNGNAHYLDSIMIYQSMSGDATGTNSTFTMTGGILNSRSGHVFHVTNTTADIYLDGVQINNDDSDDVLLSVTNDGWSGAANTANLYATNQTLTGHIIVSNTADADSQESTLNFNVNSSSSYTGYISDENNSGDSIGTVNVTLDGTWKLTGDSYVSSVSGSGSIDYNGYTLYVDGTAYTSGMPA